MYIMLICAYLYYVLGYGKTTPGRAMFVLRAQFLLRRLPDKGITDVSAIFPDPAVFFLLCFYNSDACDPHSWDNGREVTAGQSRMSLKRSISLHITGTIEGCAFFRVCRYSKRQRRRCPSWRRPALPVIVMRPRIPGPVKEEYEALYWKLNEAARLRGEVGQAAMAAFRHVQSHYLKDQEFALPPLKLLPTVAANNVNEEIDNIQTMCNRLKRNQPQLIAEGNQIIEELSLLADVAAREQKQDYHDLARRFIKFLELERDVLYPSVVLIGEYIRAQAEIKDMKEVRSQAVTLR
jgi:hypothetical protein